MERAKDEQLDVQVEVAELSTVELDAVAGGYKWEEGCRRAAIRDGSATVVLPPIKR